MPATLAQKLIARAAGRGAVTPGEIVTCKVDLAMIHDSSGPRRLKPKRSAMNPPRPILITVYVLSGILAAGGGLFTVSEVMTVDVSGTGYQMELDAILAVVIGGTSLAGGKFSILGSTIGALLIATLNKTVLFLGVSAAATPAFKAIVIVLLVLLQSERVRTFVLQAGRRRTRKEVVA